MLNNKLKRAIIEKFNYEKFIKKNPEKSGPAPAPAPAPVLDPVLALEESLPALDPAWENMNLSKPEFTNIVLPPSPLFEYYGDQILSAPIKLPLTKKEITICLYTINTANEFPFLLFLLEKDEQNQLLGLPTIDITTSVTEQDIISSVIEKLSQAGSAQAGTDTDTYTDTDKLEYKGWLPSGPQNATPILILYMKNANKKLIYNKYNSKWWWALSTELVNYKNILKFSVEPATTTFFLINNKLLFLSNPGVGGNYYETPDVGYYGNYYKYITSVASIGLRRESPFASLGPYYYFGTYEQAMRYALWSFNRKPLEIDDKLITIDDLGRYDKGGIVRFALFAGNMKVLLNRATDPPDESTISIDLAEKSVFVQATMKIRDVDAAWAEHYNSIFHGICKIQLPDKLITLDPMIVLKEFSQQVSLAYYYVNGKQSVEIDDLSKAVIS